MSVTLDALVDLRLATLAARGLVGDAAAARAALAESLAAKVASARRSGYIDTAVDRAGRLRAALLVHHHATHIASRRVAQVELVVAPRDAAGRRWAAGALARRRAALGDRIALFLDAKDASLRPALGRLGLHVTSLLLLGEAGPALARLRAAYGGRVVLPAGLAIRELSTHAQVAEVIALYRAEFRRNPQFGAFVARPRFLAHLTAELEGELDAQPSTNFVLASGPRVVGHFGFVTSRANQFGRPLASVGLTFAAEVQGRGLARLAYARLLERMRALGVEIFVGGTAQPPVMHLGRVMGRTLLGYMLGSEPPFPTVGGY